MYDHTPMPSRNVWGDDYDLDELGDATLTPPKCTKCMAGKSSPFHGATVAADCKFCKWGTGTYAPNSGQAVCEQCPDWQIPNQNRTKCIACKGNPPCAGRGRCDSKAGGCDCFKQDMTGKPVGWEGESCAQCGSKWSPKNGKCDSCAPGYHMKSGACVQDLTMPELIFTVIGYVGGCITFLGIVYKAYTFHRLKREGKLNPEINDCKAFVAVFFYGDAGKHIIVNNTMEATLLGEEDIDEGDHRVSFVEMRDRRASMDAFLTDARLSHLADKLQRDGIYGTQDLIEMEDDDLEAAGFRPARGAEVNRRHRGTNGCVCCEDKAGPTRP